MGCTASRSTSIEPSRDAETALTKAKEAASQQAVEPQQCSSSSEHSSSNESENEQKKDKNIETLPELSPTASTAANSRLPQLPVATAAKQKQKESAAENEQSKSTISKSSKLSPVGRIKWKKGELIGAGSYGKVFIGLSESTGVLMAVKEVHVSSKKEVESLQREVRLIRSLKHDNIVQYLGSEADPRSNVVYIFTQWVPGGSLSNLLQKFGRLSESVVGNYTKQILQGLSYLHKKGIIHRDIKGGNILVDDRGKIKLADFGASKVLNCGASNGSVLENQSLRGTPYFMAPEVIMQSGHGRKADIWSVGCTVIQMVSGKPPWKSMRFTSISALLFHVCNTSEPPPMPDDMSPALRSFLMITFQRDPSERPSCSHLLQHPFICIANPADPNVQRTMTPRFDIAEREEAEEKTESKGHDRDTSKTSSGNKRPRKKLPGKRPMSISPAPKTEKKQSSSPKKQQTPSSSSSANAREEEKLSNNFNVEATQHFLKELNFTEQSLPTSLKGLEQINDKDDDGQTSVGLKVPVVDELEVSSYIRNRAKESEKRLDEWYSLNSDEEEEVIANNNNSADTLDPDSQNEWTIRENTVINTVTAQKIRVERQRQEQVLLQRKQASEEKWKRELAAELEYQRRSGLRT